jgi:alkanesulfonate monooxygenase SsuD/methylene tetrahydromethanopterin reductase-like flavin-dependent oxidoreductase (luciferase family)
MNFVAFHLMPWPYLPPDFAEREDSAWVTYSNANFDPERGRELYERYLDELVSCEDLGFDAIAVNEHHQTAYGLMPSPNLVAMNLVTRTKNVRIAILGNAIPLRDHPLRVVEEVAMLDVMSGGRINCGIVRGLGAEYHSFGINPVHSQERFFEAHDLMIAAWTRPGPFEWEGKHYQFKYVNPWPRPIQDPHPPIWLPTQG